VDHGALGGLGDDDHSAIYYNKTTIDGKFDTATGHDHDGVDSKKVDHGSMLGLGDDDHTQYLNVARHDADDHSGLTGYAKIASGSYTGNDTANRAVAHGLGVTPRIVFIIGPTYTWRSRGNRLHRLDPAASWGVTAMNATNFYVGVSGAGWSNTANYSAETYYWIALA